MKVRLNPLILGLSLIGFITTPVVAMSSDDQSKKIAQLEQQIGELKQQVAALNTTPVSNRTKEPALNTDKKNKSVQSVSSSVSHSNAIAMGDSQIEGPTDLPSQGPLYLPVDLDVPGQSFVSSGPYIGIPFEFTGGHLIVNSPSVNEDIILLQVDKNVDQRLAALGRPAGKALGSHILLSGTVEGTALTKFGNDIKSSSDIDLTSMNLAAYVMGPSTWTSAFFEFAYDNNIGTQTGAFSSNNRALYSRLYVSKAFVVLGDFMKSPFYMSFGQMYVPFGVYSSTMVSGPITKTLSRTLARPLVVGYKQQSDSSLQATAYVFNGPTYTESRNHIDNGGLNVNYTFKQDKYRAVVGAGLIANVADSVGMQSTGNNTNNPPEFGGFGGPTETYVPGGATVDPLVPVQVITGNEKIAHRVPACDLNAKFAIGTNWQMIAEYIFAAKTFSTQDLTFNDKGARPEAMNMELVYNMPWFNNPTSLGFAYQKSKEALAIGMPAQRYAVTVNRSFWKNTLQSLEFRRDINYSTGDTSTGSNVKGPTGTGASANMITLQFDYFF